MSLPHMNFMIITIVTSFEQPVTYATVIMVFYHYHNPYGTTEIKTSLISSVRVSPEKYLTIID